MLSFYLFIAMLSIVKLSCILVVVILNVVMLSVAFSYCCAECHDTTPLAKFWPVLDLPESSVIMLILVMLSFVFLLLC
jgi:hypothetical protein